MINMDEEDCITKSIIIFGILFAIFCLYGMYQDNISYLDEQKNITHIFYTTTDKNNTIPDKMNSIKMICEAYSRYPDTCIIDLKTEVFNLSSD